MRPLLAAFLALASASSASAQVVQDRYGPPRPPPKPLVMASLSVTSAETSAEPYRGPMLGWSGKPAAPAQRDNASQAASEPPRAVRREPRGNAPLPPSPPLPPSLFVDPAPPPRKAPHVIGPEAAARPPAPRVQPAPAPVAVQARPAAPIQAAPAAPPAKVAVAALTPPAPRTAGASPRFYSLHREYGMTPDAIPEQSAQPRYVLIGPPDAPKATSDDDKAPASKPSAVF